VILPQKTAVRTLSPTAKFPKVDMVGPKVSDGFSDATILAILLAGTGMLGYLWIRFESHFAAAATLTIALDLTKTIGFFALTGLEFNLTAVAALLALIGYSANDKVVVFDRIRENLRLTPDKPMLQLLNESISSTLTRTVFTSVTTLLKTASRKLSDIARNNPESENLNTVEDLLLLAWFWPERPRTEYSERFAIGRRDRNP
jgi:SecD/SecF fusion protein